MFIFCDEKLTYKGIDAYHHLGKPVIKLVCILDFWQANITHNHALLRTGESINHAATSEEIGHNSIDIINVCLSCQCKPSPNRDISSSKQT